MLLNSSVDTPNDPVNLGATATTGAVSLGRLRRLPSALKLPIMVLASPTHTDAPGSHGSDGGVADSASSMKMVSSRGPLHMP